MPTAAKEEKFSAPMVWTDECVLPLVAAGVYPKTRVWGSDEKNLHCFSTTAPLKIELRWGCEESSEKTAVGSGVSFKYDPFGRRIEKASSTTTSIYAYDGDRIAETTDGAGNVFARYAQGQGIDQPLAIQQGGATSYYHPDGLGSITSLSNAAGALAQAYTFDSFGKLVTSSGSLTNPFQYTAREFDSETNLYYYRARYYDPNAGRFISEDPTSFRADVNFYRYAFDSPVNFGDPLGLQGNANTWTFGEIGSWAWLPTPGYPAPPGLGDAKASIGAACARNGGGCNSVDGSGATDPIGKAAWNNINNASGSDQSGGGNFMCVGGQGCWFVHRCYGCLNGKKTLMDRPQPLQPSGSVSVGKNTLYFYNDPLQGWCNETDRKSGCKCNPGK